MRKHFVATGFVVKGNKTLLLRHRKLGLWLPPGGHIEGHETPEEALRREVMEETGLEIEILGKPGFEFKMKGVSVLLLPNHVQLEDIADKEKGLHQHIDLIFFCRPKGGKLRLNRGEHHEMRWFSAQDLESSEISEDVRVLGKKAIEIARELEVI